MQMIELEVKSSGVIHEETRNLLLYYNLEHWLRVTQANRVTVLKPNDLLLVNSKAAHTVECSDGLYVRCEIDLLQMKALFPGKRLRFLCDSTTERNSNYELVRKQLKTLLRCWFEPDAFRQARVAQESYGLLILLAANFRIVEVEQKESSDAEELTDYIEQNYQEELSLRQISEVFHMTPQYFSKYFKQTVGQNFFKYLSQIRLEHAVEQLLRTNEQVLSIALSSGFPSGESFYRSFQEAYHTTPQEYRRSSRAEQVQTQKVREAMWEKALTALNADAAPVTEQTVSLDIDPADAAPVEPIWSKLVNLGSFRVLRDAELREQLEILQAAIHYEYARIALPIHPTETPETFYEEERALDTMRSLKLKLWLVIPLVTDVPVERVEAHLRAFLSCMANRVSIHGIRAWRYELVCGPDLRDDPASCWKLYSRFASLLERFGCEGLIGFGLPLGDMERIRNFYQLRPAELPLPMQSFQADPFLRLDTGEGTATLRSTDSSNLKNRILAVQQAIPEFRSGTAPLYITDWDSTTQRRDLLNDSCFRGAEILKNVTEVLDCVQAIAPRMPLDLMDPDALHEKLLFGGAGLMTRSGIKKPSFYSYSFLSRSGKCLAAKGEHAIAFNHDRNFQILCHNSKRQSYRYYLDEQHLKLDRIEEYFDDLTPLQLRFRLKGIPDGNYIVKTRLVSPHCGSILQLMRWTVERGDIYLHPNDIEYLRQTAIPKLRLEQITVSGGCMEFNTELPGNAFAHIHIIYQF